MSCCAVGGAVCLRPERKSRLRLFGALKALVRLPDKDREDGREQDAQAAVNRQAADFLERYGSAILRCAYMYLHNMADAEDILQETLIRYLRSRPVLENEKHEKAWLLRVASNLSKNRLQYNALRASDELRDELVQEGEDDLTFVWDAVRDLPEHQREAIHLYYYEGYSTAEIGGIVGRKESTVRSDLRRGRESLKSILKEAFDFEQPV